jgi:DNA repair protein RadC
MSIIKNVPLEERPYEKCFFKGPQFLTDCELLSVILRTGTKGESAYDLARRILNQGNETGNLLSIMHLSKEQLMEFKGIGMVKAVQIMCIGELAKRISGLSAKNGLKFDKPATIAEYYMEKMRHLEQENLLAIFLDTKCQMIKDAILTTGTVNSSFLSPREIFIEGLKCNAVQMILLHNHPSGDCTPSKADIASTLNISKAGKLIGIPLLDHIVIGDRKYCSFKELNLL